jgi:Raf kinase inhibitor-like YbhB/YbcL family protein
MKLQLCTSGSLAVLLTACPALAQQGDGTAVAISAHVVKPDKVSPTDERIAQIKAPAGFAVMPFATGLKNARILAVAPNGTVYLTRRDQGDVLMLRDADGDGRADGEPVQVAARPGAHGLAIRDGKLYLITVKEVFVADILEDGRLGPLTMIMGDLPDAGQHANRTMAFGPDGMLYISIGSTCNACNESNQENATIVRASPDGKMRSVIARGLRNTIGFSWHPATGELWGMDHGIDYLGDDDQPEELNKIEQGKEYGWPHVWGAGGLNPQSTPVGEISKEQWKKNSVPMKLGYIAHAAPMQMVFYSGGSFPKDYEGDAFVTMRGSWNRDKPSGYEIVRIHFENGQPKGIEPFVTGFLTDGGKTHIARPVGLAIARDGALLMADDANGVIYRISHTGGPTGVAASSTSSPPASEMKRGAMRDVGLPLTLQREETSPDKKEAIKLTSPSIPDGGTIPERHSDYADGVSPTLVWTPVGGVKSYAIIAEDPDATPIKPFVHWVAWNIPGDLSSLPEGLQEQPRLTDPEGVMQGMTSRGFVGYYGPRPPVGDKPHHYHFQILALNTTLDVPVGADRDEVLKAATGRVIAKGELVGTYSQAIKPPK